MTDTVRVANAAQATVLLEVELRPLLTALMERPHSAAEVGRSLKQSVQRAHYLIGKLIAVGVAQLDSVTPRAGRPVKRYRVAPRWFVPFEVTGSETLEAFLSAQILPRMDQFVSLSVRQLEAAYGTWGYWLEQDEGGNSLRVGDPENAALELFTGDEPLLLNIGSMHLSREHAVSLKHRLNALMSEFHALDDPGAQPAYTVAIQLVRGEVG